MEGLRVPCKSQIAIPTGLPMKGKENNDKNSSDDRSRLRVQYLKLLCNLP